VALSVVLVGTDFHSKKRPPLLALVQAVSLPPTPLPKTRTSNRSVSLKMRVLPLLLDATGQIQACIDFTAVLPTNRPTGVNHHMNWETLTQAGMGKIGIR
jgi:hypothetical protein